MTEMREDGFILVHGSENIVHHGGKGLRGAAQNTRPHPSHQKAAQAGSEWTM